MLKTGLHISRCKVARADPIVVCAIVCFSSDLQIKVIQLFTLVSPVNLCFSQNNQNNAYHDDDE